MADWILTERSNIVAVADSIREKTGQTGKLTLGEMVDDINNTVGGTTTVTATHDGNGNVYLSGVSAASDKSGNITIV